MMPANNSHLRVIHSGDPAPRTWEPPEWDDFDLLDVSEQQWLLRTIDTIASEHEERLVNQLHIERAEHLPLAIVPDSEGELLSIGLVPFWGAVLLLLNNHAVVLAQMPREELGEACEAYDRITMIALRTFTALLGSSASSEGAAPNADSGRSGGDAS